MKERPILMNGEMVRAVIEGRKTQTRRPITSKHPTRNVARVIPVSEVLKLGRWKLLGYDGKCLTDGYINCPFGIPGDRLWVRETWSPMNDAGAVWYQAGVPVYRAGRWDGHSWELCNPVHGLPVPADIKWRPSIHMPRWASRITLEVTDVRVQRLQETRSRDLVAEGYKGTPIEDLYAPEVIAEINRLPVEQRSFALSAAPTIRRPIPPREWFREIWDAIYARRGLGWDANPWVWAIMFRNIDESNGIASLPNSANCGISGAAS